MAAAAPTTTSAFEEGRAKRKGPLADKELFLLMLSCTSQWSTFVMREAGECRVLAGHVASSNNIGVLLQRKIGKRILDKQVVVSDIFSRVPNFWPGKLAEWWRMVASRGTG